MLWLASSRLARKLPCKRICTPIIDYLAIGQSHFLLTNQQFIFIHTQWKLVYGIGTLSLLISHHALLASSRLARKLPCKCIFTPIIDALQQRIVATLDSLEVKTHEVEVKGGRSIKATRSQSNRTVIDETGLKKSLGETLWNKVSSRVLDKKKLEAFIASGEVSATAVAKCSTENEGKPYIRITA